MASNGAVLDDDPGRLSADWSKYWRVLHEKYLLNSYKPTEKENLCSWTKEIFQFEYIYKSFENHSEARSFCNSKEGRNYLILKKNSPSETKWTVFSFVLKINSGLIFSFKSVETLFSLPLL